MYTSFHLLITAIACGLTGIIVGIIATRYFDPQQKENQALEARLGKAEEKLEEYQHQVTEHFTHTAGLVNNLTAGYKEIHEYLATSASALGNVDISQTILPNDSDSAIPSIASGEVIEAPKDYAPRNEDSPSTLAEDFGLKDDIQANRG